MESSKNITSAGKSAWVHKVHYGMAQTAVALNVWLNVISEREKRVKCFKITNTNISKINPCMIVALCCVCWTTRVNKASTFVLRLPRTNYFECVCTLGVTFCSLKWFWFGTKMFPHWLWVKGRVHSIHHVTWSRQERKNTRCVSKGVTVWRLLHECVSEWVN